MNNNDILNKYIDLIDKGYCCACNELNCIDNFPQTKITHAIKKLQQENKQLKDNWDELKEYIGIKLYNVEYLQKLCGCRIDDEIHIILDIIKKKIQELEKGSDGE